MGLPPEVVSPLHGTTGGSSWAGHSQLAHLGLAGVGLLPIVGDQDVVGFLCFEGVIGLDSEGWVVHMEGKLGRVDKHVLEGDVDARSSPDGKRPLWLGREAVAKEGDAVVPSCCRGNEQGGLGVTKMGGLKLNLHTHFSPAPCRSS